MFETLQSNVQIFFWVGMVIAGSTLAAILWSIVIPNRRLWPPKRYSRSTPILVWVPTFSLFGVLLLIGIAGWGTLDWPGLVRFGLGPAFILIGNAIVWTEVAHFGVPQTGGAVGTLRVDGFYRYSRNPQYVADIMIVLGWIFLCAAPFVGLVGAASITVLIAAPFSEEPWLADTYGETYQTYRAKVRRFF